MLKDDKTEIYGPVSLVFFPYDFKTYVSVISSAIYNFAPDLKLKDMHLLTVY